MVKKLITVLTIVSILLTLGIVECVLVKNYIEKLDENVDKLIIEFEASEDNILPLVPEIENIKNQWDKNECVLCLMFNHKDMTSINDCLSRLLSFTMQNNYDDAIVEVYLLKEYSEKNPHIMGCNFNNIL